jgi:quercetin dioxygenase-like cupin family protein
MFRALGDPAKFAQHGFSPRTRATKSAKGIILVPCSAATETPVWLHSLDDRHLCKVLAGEETDEYPVWIGNGQSRSSRSVEPIEHGF